MAGVDFRYVSKPGALPVVSFADTLIGVDRPFLIGNNWFLQATADETTAMSDNSALINIGGTGLIYGNGGGLNLNGMSIAAFPSTVNRTAIVARSAVGGIFSQVTLVSRPIAGVDASIGPSVFMNPGDAACYLIQLRSQDTTTSLYRKNSNGTYTNIRASAFANAPGDVVRLEGRIVGGFPELRIYQNGVLRSTDIDNSGLGPTSGQFGFFMSGVFTGQVVISTFSGGTL